MRPTNGQKTQMIKTIVGCPATLRFGVAQDRLRHLSEKDALRPVLPLLLQLADSLLRERVFAD